MKDFDLAYSLLAMAAALRVNDNNEEAHKYLEEAKKFGESIKAEEDKEIFMKELKLAAEQFSILMMKALC